MPILESASEFAFWELAAAVVGAGATFLGSLAIRLQQRGRHHTLPGSAPAPGPRHASDPPPNPYVP